MLLEPSLLERLERLSMATRARLAGLYPGEHRSRKLGSSQDFADRRPYVAGDDYRRIDVQVLARLDRLVVRLYEAEEELDLRCIVDASASMGFHGKLDAAKSITAALGYLAACRKDRAQVWVSDGDGTRPGPPMRSKDSAGNAFRWIESVEAGGSPDLAAAITKTAASSGWGYTVLASDLLTPDWESVIRRLAAARGEAALVHMLAATERDPAIRGDLSLVDSESGGAVEVSVSTAVLAAYKKRFAAWMADVASACRKRGIRYVAVDPDDDLTELLMVRLRREGLVR